jgi:hypothetical protein
MKVHRILLLSSVVALPQLALADLASTNPQGLGDVHALLAFCAKVDPANAGSFTAEWNSIVGGAAAKQLDQVEDGGPYKLGYDALMATLEKLPLQQVIGICAASAVAWNGPAHPVSAGGDDRTPQRPGTRAERPEHPKIPLSLK